MGDACPCRLAFLLCVFAVLCVWLLSFAPAEVGGEAAPDRACPLPQPIQVATQLAKEPPVASFMRTLFRLALPNPSPTPCSVCAGSGADSGNGAGEPCAVAPSHPPLDPHRVLCSALCLAGDDLRAVAFCACNATTVFRPTLLMCRRRHAQSGIGRGGANGTGEPMNPRCKLCGAICFAGRRTGAMRGVSLPPAP